jgi:hypothetical protein
VSQWFPSSSAAPGTPLRPFYGGQKCYACDARPVGLADRRFSAEGDLEPACARHRDPAIKVYDACMYCDRAVRSGSLDVDGNFAHRKCHKEVTA